MSENLKFEEVKKIIFDAFKDVKKENGIGMWEAGALDDYATPEDQAKAREKDGDTNWFDIKTEWEGQLSTALCFTNKEGFRFLLPALMYEGDGDSVFFQFCNTNKESNVQSPHKYFPEYIHFLKSIDPKKTVEYYGFNEAQVHAIALFLKWWMQEEESYLYEDRQPKIEKIKRRSEFLSEKMPKHYKLTDDDAILHFDEECQILRDWLLLGNVSE